MGYISCSFILTLTALCKQCNSLDMFSFFSHVGGILHSVQFTSVICLRQQVKARETNYFLYLSKCSKNLHVLYLLSQQLKSLYEKYPSFLQDFNISSVAKDVFRRRFFCIMYIFIRTFPLGPQQTRNAQQSLVNLPFFFRFINFPFPCEDPWRAHYLFSGT